ncbi:MAG: DUF4838 domain-containing protein [Kiritimatiellae bacterium]|nr:DUF4838 domain-containing protein [Kiritimatiellia bacterium]
MKKRVAVCAALAAVLVGCAMFAPKTFDGVDIAPGDMHAPDLTRLDCVRCPGGDPIVVVRGDKALLPVVCRQGMERPAKYLAETIFEMTGAKPAVIVERNNGKAVTNAPAFYIGDTDAANRAGLLPFRKKKGRWDGVESERFRVLTKDGSVYFIGAAHHAVYDWCERQLGVRFYWPRRPSEMYAGKGTNYIYGKCTIPTKGLAVRPVDYEDQPVFDCRNNWPYGGTAWNVASKGADTHRGGVNVHAPHGWYKDTNLVARLPDIFARTSEGRRATSPLLCYGNPKTLEYYKERIVDEIEHGKSAGGIVNMRTKVVTVSQWDCGVYCTCEYCEKLFDPKLGQSGSASPIIWGYFTKELAKWMKEKYPDWIISTLPYVNTCDVPPGLDLTREGNVEAMLCTMPGLAMLKNKKCKQHEEDLIRQWAKATGRRVLNWHYSCWPAEFTSAPFVYGETIQKHYSDMRDCLSGTFINGGYDAPRLSLSAYVWMRCLWNPDVDVHAIYDTFCERMFGKAAKTMRKLIDMQEGGWNRQWASNMCSPKNIHEISYPRKDVLEMKALLAKATEETKGDEKATARLEWYKLGFVKFFKESDETAAGTAFPDLIMKKAVAQPVIDGKLDDACWATAEPRDFVSAYCKTNPAPWLKTTVRAVWTDKGVTYGIKCMEPAVEKMNLAAPKGDPWSQDTFEIFMDCSGRGEGHWYQLLLDCNKRISYFSDTGNWKGKDVKVGIHSGQGFWSMEVYVPYSDLDSFEHGQFPTTSANGCVWTGNMIRWRVGDMKLPKEQRIPDSRREMSRLNTRFSHWNRDQAAFSKWVFRE